MQWHHLPKTVPVWGVPSAAAVPLLTSHVGSLAGVENGVWGSVAWFQTDPMVLVSPEPTWRCTSWNWRSSAPRSVSPRGIRAW